MKLIIVIVIFLLILWCACKVSSNCSRKEEQEETKKKINKLKHSKKNKRMLTTNLEGKEYMLDDDWLLHELVYDDEFVKSEDHNEK